MLKEKRTRRHLSPEFKAETVRLVREGGRGVGQVARELGLDDSLLRTWIKQAGDATLDRHFGLCHKLVSRAICL